MRACALISLLVGVSMLVAQAPTGTVRGTVIDPSGAVVPSATVEVENKQAGLLRSTRTNEVGEYVVPQLPPGRYEVRGSAAGFSTKASAVELFVGRDLSVDFQLEVGQEKQIVSVEAEAARVDPTEYKVEGIVSRQQISNLPLNGRNALELARLQPGVLVSTGVPSGKNGFVSVSVGGETSAATRVTVDGGSVNDYVTGGVLQNFSQEVVQEFQVSVGNFDPSTGITSAGAVNIITRSGSNQFHGSGFLYGRDNALSANPELERNPIEPNPRFDREQYGWLASGPLIRDHFFWLTSVDRTRQRGVSVLNANNLDLTAFNSVKDEPFNVMLQTHKLDWVLGDRHRMNLRYSRDGNQGRAGGGLIESQRINQNSADQYLLNWNAALTPRFVSDYRIQFNKFSNYYKPTPEAQQAGIPWFEVRQSNVRFGMDDNSPQSTLLGRLEMSDNISHQVGRHSLKYGGSFERDRGRGSWQYVYPASSVLYSPAEARAAGIPIPSAFKTRQDLLQLPLAGFDFGVGNPEQPPYHPERSRINHRVRFYLGDSWRLGSRFTLNLALGYSFEDNLVNKDLPKPRSLAKILNGNLNINRTDWNNWSPMIGFAWSPVRNSRTVIRGGWGIYYDTIQSEVRLIERTFLAPYGVGYLPLSQAQVPNPFNPKQSLDFITNGPTPITGALLLTYLPTIRAAFESEFAKLAKNEDLSFTNLDAFRAGYGILDPDITTPYSMHYSLGVQRELPGGVLLSADGEFKQSVHQFFQADYNKFRRVGGSPDPSFQSVSFFQSGGTARYKALLVRAEKRYSRRYQFIASYALSSFVGLNGGGLYLGDDVSDNDNWKDSFGPQGSDHRHRLVASASIDLPRAFQVSLISEATSRGPAGLGAGNYDYNGDGTRGDRLPGTGANQVNRSIHESDIPGLVQQFNSQWAGKKDAQGQTIRAIPALPSRYQLGETAVTQDLRLTKTFRITERWQIIGIGEVFNIFNIANLGGYSGDLSSARFGQPTSRFGNVFGSGGPRAFQFALRVSY